ncbi:MAG: MarR family transcriptional regulator [Acidimicrobiales bacterium]|jgi:DNA-binding MarR family transcriptional regulator
MEDAQASRLFELADLILAVGRQIHASKDVPAEPWTPLESAVMRFIDRNPGTSASAAAEATQMISSNFSRALRGLEAKGLVRRDVDQHDGRRVRLSPTPQAHDNLQRLRDVWSRLLDGIVNDPEEIDHAISTLRRIETELTGRARRDA